MKEILLLLCAAIALFTYRLPARRRRAAAMFDAYNESPPPDWDKDRPLVVADIANAKPVDDEAEWFQVAPYGDHPNRVGLQVFNEAAAQKIVESFNSVSAKIGRLFRGLPIYAGHPDVDPARWGDDRRLGKITALEARNDGLYAQASWNSLGAENNAQGFRVFPSPRWLCEKVSKGIMPVELVSVGLTNTPNIRSSAPVTANDEAASGSDADASNAALVAMTGERDAANAQVGTLTIERDELKTQLQAANDALVAEKGLRRDLIIEHAIESGRITPADKPALIALFNSDWAAGEADLLKRKPAYNTQKLDLPKDRKPLADASERRTAQLEAVNEIMSETGRTYDEAWEVLQSDAKYKHLIAAV